MNGGQEQSPSLLSLVHQLTTRDGLLTKDSRMVNCYPEQTENGPAAVKRPGLTLQGVLGAGIGQGIFNFGTGGLAFIGGTPYVVNSGLAVAIDSGPSTTQPFFGSEIGLLTTGFNGGVVKQSRHLWLLNVSGGSTLSFTATGDANYPGVTVPGLAALDHTSYVMDNNGNIRGCDLDNPNSWPALNSLKADPLLGAPQGIHRHLSYVVGFFDKGVQLYYDAGNPSGSPLLPVSNGSFRTGCVSGFSVAEVDDVTYFIGKSTNSAGRSVFAIDGGQLAEVGNPHVNRVLNAAFISTDIETATVRAFGVKSGGHSFYFLNLVQSGITLVYDITYKHWHVWTSVVAGVEQNFVGVASNATPATAGWSTPTAPSVNYIQDYSTGAVYVLSDTAYQDYTGQINTRIVTKNYDWGTFRRKFFEGMYLLADTVASTIAVSYSDDDYATFSTARSIDLSKVKKFLVRIGSSRRRAWQFLHTANTPLKLYGAEVPLKVEGQ